MEVKFPWSCFNENLTGVNNTAIGANALKIILGK